MTEQVLYNARREFTRYICRKFVCIQKKKLLVGYFSTILAVLCSFFTLPKVHIYVDVFLVDIKHKCAYLTPFANTQHCTSSGITTFLR